MSESASFSSGNPPAPDLLIQPVTRADFRNLLRRQWIEGEESMPTSPAVPAPPPASPPASPTKTPRSGPRAKGSDAPAAISLTRDPAKDPEEQNALEHPDIELLREIERDDISSLHEGYERGLRRYVTVRKLLPELRGESALEDLFWSQARGGAGFQHEQIQAIYSIDLARRWVILEPFDHSLAARLKKGALPPQEVQRVLEQALRGLAYLHSRGKIHGGIHPGNLLINKDDQLKLTRTPGLDPRAELRLPPGGGRYLAPELLAPQMFGKVGPACDLYALGLTALELLTGPRFVKLFKGVSGRTEGPDAWARWHCSPIERLPSVGTLARGISAELARVLDRMLEKQVGDRYSSANDALADLLGGTALIRTGRAEPAGEVSSTALVPRNGTVGQVDLSIPPSLLPIKSSPQRIMLPGEMSFADARPPSEWKALLSSPKSLLQVALGGVFLLFLATLILPGSPPSEPPAAPVVAAVVDRPMGNEIPIRDEDMPEDRFAENDPPVMEQPAPPVPVPVPPPPPPAPPDPEPVQVVLTSVPIGAMVEIDGLNHPQRTPATVPLLPGEYSVTIRLAHHKTQRRQIAVTPQTSKPFQFALNLQQSPEVQVPRIPPPTGGVRGPAAQLIRRLLEQRWKENRTFPPNEQEEFLKKHADLLKTDPRIPHALALLVLYERPGKGVADKTPRLRRATVLLEEADHLSPPPQYILHLRRLAWCHLQMGGYDEALTVCSRMLSRSAQSDDETLHREAVRFSAAALVLADEAKQLGWHSTNLLLREMSPPLQDDFWHDVEDVRQQLQEGKVLSQILPEPLAVEPYLILQTLEAGRDSREHNRPQEPVRQAATAVPSPQHVP